jgi:hypothetical protein
MHPLLYKPHLPYDVHERETTCNVGIVGSKCYHIILYNIWHIHTDGITITREARLDESKEFPMK